MASHVLGLEVEINCSADKFYGFCKNDITQFQNYFPETFKSIHVIEGHQSSVGSVRLWKYVLDGHLITTKERMVYANDETRSITWSFLEGHITNVHPSFQIKLLSVTPTREGVSLTKWSVNFDNSKGDSSIPSAFINLLRRVSLELASQLLKEG
ncbi:hypothetical protein MKX01_011778 [Papaver californicum]|nr:hypothetical protein MKX01_011778 [Papaver californicum]